MSIFFIKGIPFDLKVTYLPREYTECIQHKLGFIKPLSKLKQYAKAIKMPYDKKSDSETIQHELIERIKDEANTQGLALLSELRQDRIRIKDHILTHKYELLQWLYENQGDMRFGAENRIFLIMVDSAEPHYAWKLKRNTDLIRPAIQKWIECFEPANIESLAISFSYHSKTYHTFADAIFICK